MMVRSVILAQTWYRACGHVCGALSGLMIDVGGALWSMPPLDGCLSCIRKQPGIHREPSLKGGE